MKWRIFGTVLVLLLLVSCSKEESKANTQSFLAGLNTTAMSATGTEGARAIADFIDKDPPLASSCMKASMPLGLASLADGNVFAPPGLDTMYGTWKYYPAQGWVHIDTLDPAEAIRYEWDFWDDSTQTEKSAYVLLDSLQFAYDTLPENIRVSLGIVDGGSDDELVWVTFSAEYNSPEEISAATVIFTIVDYFQFGAAVTSATSIEEDFVGTVHFWAIDYTSNDYRIDLTITMNQDDSGGIVLEDSDDWIMDVDITSVVETDTVGSTIFEKRDVDGEITHSGNHAADITGCIWEPEDNDHVTEIVIVYPDGTEESLENYVSTGGTKLGIFSIKPW